MGQRMRMGNPSEINKQRVERNKEIQMKTGKQKKAGFTLVELMVVAIIVAILAAVAIPLMSGNKKRAAATEAQAACSTIQTAEQTYRAEHGTYMVGITDPHSLPGISTGDLAGKYFPDSGYTMTSAANTFTITGTASYSSDTTIDGGTVTLTVTYDPTAHTMTSTWGGTLLN
jgi:prepilin-type N-terminal cleavage/methylation domain-containing protein